VLRVLFERGAECLNQGELVAAMSSDPNTVASLLGRMERRGLVQRCPHPRDRRARCLRLRAKGLQKFLEVRRLALRLQKEVLSVLPKAERERFLEQLERVAQTCWRAAVGDRPHGPEDAKPNGRGLNL
jgi:DNA-binding MarR family transcriptional regulator